MIKLEAALAYRERGWYPIPLCWPGESGQCACGKEHKSPKEIGKAPLLGERYQDLRPTPEMIRVWWTRWPQANIGILLEPSGLIDIDTDSPEAEAEAQSLGLPETYTYTSAAGHAHHLYLSAEGATHRRTKQGASRAIDVLGAGYVAVPPSVHRTGAVYTVIRDIAPVPAPQWALELARNGTGIRKAEAVALPDNLPKVNVSGLRVYEEIKRAIYTGQPQGTADQSRSAAVGQVVMAMLKAGHTEEEIASVLLDPENGISERVLEQRNPRQYVADEIARAKESRRMKSAKVTSLESHRRVSMIEGEQELPRFPLHLYRTIGLQSLATYYEELGRSMRDYPDYGAVQDLAVLGTAIGNTTALLVRKGWIEVPMIWLATIRPSSMLKTPTFTKVIEPVNEETQRLVRQRQEALRVWEQQTLQYQADLSAWKRARKRGIESPAPPAPPEEPPERQVRIGDITPEALADVLSANPRGVGLLEDELTSWILRLDQYKDGRPGAERGLYMEIWSGHMPPINRRNRKQVVYVPRPFVCILGNIQPSKLVELGRNGQEDGFIHRFFYAYAPTPDLDPAERGTAPPPISDGAMRQRFEIYRRLFGRPLVLDDDGVPQPRVVTLSPEASRLFEEFEWDMRHRAQKLEAETPGSVLGPLHLKAPRQVARLALVLHCAAEAAFETEEPVLTAQEMEAALGLGEFFVAHGAEALTRMVAGESFEAVEKVIRWLRARGGKARIRDIVRAGIPGITATSLQGTLDTLEALGEGIRYEDGRAAAFRLTG